VLHVWNLDTKSETLAIGLSDGSGKMVVNLVFSADGKILGFVLISRPVFANAFLSSDFITMSAPSITE
jgi:hypothetical protein